MSIQDSTASGGQARRIQGRVDPPVAPVTVSEPKFSPLRAFFSNSYRMKWEALEGAAKAELSAQSTDRAEYSRILQDGVRRMGARKGTVTVINSKGGVGKTPTLCYAASVIGEYGRRHAVVLEHNQMGGTADMQLGLQGSGGLSVRDAARLFRDGKLDSSTDFESKLPVTPHGVFLVQADEVVAGQDYYNNETSEANITGTLRHMPFVFNDTDNGLQNSASAGVLKFTDVLLLVTEPDEASLRACKNSKKNLIQWGYEELVRNSITIVTGLGPDDDLESFRDNPLLELSSNQLLFGVPYDQKIKQRVAVDLYNIDLDLLIAYEEITLAILYVLHAKVNPTIAARLPSLRSGSMVELSSGRTPVLPWLKSA